MSDILKLTVENVKCGGCAQAITDGLTPLEGVDRIEVDVASGTVTITGSAIAEASIQAKLAELGYPVKS